MKMSLWRWNLVIYLSWASMGILNGAQSMITGENGSFQTASPFIWSTETIHNGSLIVNDGGSVSIEITDEAISPESDGTITALKLQNGIDVLVEETAGAFDIGNSLNRGRGIQATDERSQLKLSQGNISAKTSPDSDGIALDGGSGVSGLLDVTLSGTANSSISGHLAMRGIHSFLIDNRAGSWKITGIADLSAAQSVHFTANSILTLAPEKNVETFIQLGANGVVVESDAKLELLLKESVAKGDSIKILQWAESPKWNISQLDNFHWDVFLNADSQKSDWQWKNDLENRQILLSYAGPYWQTIDNQTPFTFAGGIFTDDKTGHCGQIYFLMPDKNAAETCRQLIFADGTLIYSQNTLGAPLIIDCSSKPKNADGNVISNGSWENVTLQIDLGSHADQIVVQSALTPAISQGISPRENDSSGDADGRSEFIAPTISFKGSGIIDGKTACEMHGIADWNDIYEDHLETNITLGNVIVGETSADQVILRGGVRHQIFPAKNIADGNFRGTYNLGDFVLAEGSSIEGAVIWDGSVQIGGDCHFEGTLCASDFDLLLTNIDGKIRGRAEDRVGFCSSNAIWANGSAASTIELAENSSFVNGDFRFSGSIQNQTAKSHYSGIVLDGFVHKANSDMIIHYIPENFFGTSVKIIGGQIDVNAPSGFGTGIAIRRFGINDNSANDLIENALVIATDTLRNQTPAISASDVGLLFEGMASDSPLLLSLLSGEITGQKQAAIVAHDATIHVTDSRKIGANNEITCGDFVLHGANGILPGSGRYAYENGATFVTEIDKIPLRDANLGLIIDSNNGFKIDGGAEVTTLSQTGGSQGLEISGRLTIGKNATISSGIFHANGGICWLAKAAADEKSREILRFDGNKMASLQIGGFDASEIGVGDGKNRFAPQIELSGKDENTIYVRGNILGNNDLHGGDDNDAYLQLKLAGNGGKILGNVTNLGSLCIETQDNGKIWTIEGDLSCGKLKISRGHFVQKGTITVWGNVWLLGCDFSWENAQFNRGFYGKEDKIWARENSKAVFRNGFFWENDAVKSLENQFQSQAILLGGDGQLQVDEAVGLLRLEVAGMGENAAESPVAIRIPELHECRAKPHWLQLPENYYFGFNNSINLSQSLEIHYFDDRGNPFHGTGTAIRGNAFTTVNLRGENHLDAQSLAGEIDRVGQLNVFGYWFLPDGISNIGQLHIHRRSQLNLGKTSLAAQFIRFDLDSARRNAYLLCGEILPKTRFEIHFDDTMLANSDRQRYLLIGALNDAEMARNRIEFLNLGDFTTAADGDNLYIVLPENLSVDDDHPRKIYYMGLLSSESPENSEGKTEQERKFVAEENAAETVAMISENAEFAENGGEKENLTAEKRGPTLLRANFTNREIGRSSAANTSHSLAQAQITQQQIFQLRQQLLNGDASACQIRGKTTFHWENFAGFSRRQYGKSSSDRVKADHYGTLLAAEKYVENGISLRGLAGYGGVNGTFHREVFPGNDVEDSLRQQSFLGGLGIQWQRNHWQWQCISTVTFDHQRYDRTLSLEKIHGKFNGRSLGFAGEIAYKMAWGNLGIRPRLGINYDTIHQRGHSAGENWAVAPYGAEFLQTWLGMRLETPETHHGQGYGEVAWINECHRRGQNAKINQNGAGFETADGFFGSRHLIATKIGLKCSLGKCWHGDIYYNLLAQRHFTDHALGLQLARIF